MLFFSALASYFLGFLLSYKLIGAENKDSFVRKAFIYGCLVNGIAAFLFVWLFVM